MWIFCLTLCFSIVAGLSPQHLRSIPLGESSKRSQYFIKYSQAPKIDNFDVTSRHYVLKYLINDSHFKKNGPLFFYAGNEGPIEVFANNTGIMYDLAPQFDALVLFVEHRFYGKTLRPFGTESFESVDKARFLTIEQTLADYVAVINSIRQKYSFSKTIAFGGSYGGMMAAWFRIKYPNVIDGSWASSAPIAHFRNVPNVELGGFYSIVSKTMETFGCNNDAVREAFASLDDWDKSDYGKLNDYLKVNKTFSEIKSPSDIWLVKNSLQSIFVELAMTGYPYETDFLTKLGPWPMIKACGNLKNTGQNKEVYAKALRTALDAYIGEKELCFKEKCDDQATAGLGDLRGWYWQSCTQIALYICAQGGKNDVFWEECSPKTFEDSFRQMCKGLQNIVKDYSPTFIDFDYIGKNFGYDLEGISHIILSQGALDPWSAGGAKIDEKISIKRNVFSFDMDGAAHHLDLRSPRKCDPLPVKSARFQIVGILKCWTGQSTNNCNPESLRWKLPDWDKKTDPTDCDYEEYPWGQGHQQ